MLEDRPIRRKLKQLTKAGQAASVQIRACLKSVQAAEKIASELNMAAMSPEQILVMTKQVKYLSTVARAIRAAIAIEE